MTSGSTLSTAPGAPSVGTRRVARELAWSLLLATVLGIALALHAILASASFFGRPLPWAPTLAGVLRQTWLWALLTPAILSVSRRFPVLAPHRWRHLAAHLAAALAIAGVYAAVNSAVVVMAGYGPEVLRPMFLVGEQRHPPGPPPGSKPDGFEPDGPAPERLQPGGPGPERFGPGGPKSERFEPPRLDGGGPLWPRPPEFWRRFEPPPWTRRMAFDFATRLHLHLAVYAAIAAAWHWTDHQRRFRHRERQAQELGRQLTEARLQALRMQLNPHFLFNTLNAIATLVHRDPRAADEMIACLSDFLRLTLAAEARPENSLRAELEFARRYLDIEKVRFGERLAVIEDIAPATLDLAVPTLVLQPLLENAIRHGIERSERPGEIRLESRLVSAACLQIVIADTGAGLEQDREEASPRPGVGLANTRARLRELYGDAASLELTPRPGGGVWAELRLPPRPLLANVPPEPCSNRTTTENEPPLTAG